MKLLFVSNLYPSAVEPNRAPFNRQLMKAISSVAEVRVIAPFAWFPGQALLRGRNMPPVEETIEGINVSHPRVFHTPGILIHKHWQMYRRSVRAQFETVVKEYRPDQVMIGFAYPDGVAVAPLCRELGVSYSIRVNGSDFNIRVRQEKFRRMVLETLNEAPLVFCPGSALKRNMMAEGIDGGKIVVFENGVDHERFRHRERDLAAKELSVISYQLSVIGGQATVHSQHRIILFVGNLADVKRPDLMLEAFVQVWNSYQLSVASYQLPVTSYQLSVASYQGTGNRQQSTGCSGNKEQITNNQRQLKLVFIGEGPMRGELQRMARRFGVADAVVFLGSRSNEEVALWMNAADCLCLTSRSEGMPNVVAEALASGVPVVATAAGAVSEMLEGEKCARIVRPSDGRVLAADFAEAVKKVLETVVDRKAMAERYSGRYLWKTAAEKILKAIATIR